jgi:hypothetical protein
VSPAKSGFYGAVYGHGLQRTPVVSGFFDDSYEHGKRIASPVPTQTQQSWQSEYDTRQSHTKYASPAFEVNMQVAFCDNSAKISGSGKIIRVILPGEKDNAYSTHLGAFDPDVEILYELESDVFLPLGKRFVKESMMWKIKGTLQRNDAKLNPAHRPLVQEHAALTSQLLTVSEIERHEQRIYQTGYTPKAIREPAYGGFSGKRHPPPRSRHPYIPCFD